MTNITIPSEENGPGNKSQGWLQSDKDTHKAMWQLGAKHPTALTILHFMISKMARGTNGVVISAAALARQIGIHERTVKNAVVILRDKRFVQILKTGGSNAYIINSKVAWQGQRGMRYTSFNAQIILDEQEQVDNVDELEAAARQQLEVPVIEFDGDEPLGGFDADLVIDEDPAPASRRDNKKQGKLGLDDA